MLSAGGVFQGATVAEGGSVVVTAGMLRYVDGDNSDAELVFTLTTAPVHGVLTLNGTALVQGDAFTQADINNELLGYTHDGSETATDMCGFTVDDGLGGAVEGSLAFFIDPVNDSPENFLPYTSAGERLTTNQGVNILFTGVRAVSVADPDAGIAPIQCEIEIAPPEGAAVIFVTTVDGVDAVGNGTTRLTLTGPIDGINETLSTLVYEILDGAAFYTDTMTITTDDNGFYGRGGALIDVSAVHIKVNAVPVLAHNEGLTVNEGASAAIGADLLQVVDPDSVPDFVMVTGPRPGHPVSGRHGTCGR